jgi:hypothetical protein
MFNFDEMMPAANMSRSKVRAALKRVFRKKHNKSHHFPLSAVIRVLLE